MLNFDNFEFKMQDYDNNSSCFSLSIDGIDSRQFIFKANSADECAAWKNEILRHINHSDGLKYNKSACGLRHPWRFTTIAEDNFIKNADTGDILLFKGNSVNSGLIRTFTKSKFDHVAMILKFDMDQGEVYMVESTGNRGVALNKWEYLRPFVGPKQFYKKAVLR